MSGGYFVVGPCYACGQVFTFNPVLVPSLPIDPQTRLPLDVTADGRPKPIDPDAQARAIKQPVCESCITKVNAARMERSLPPFEVLPGAYDFVEGLPP